MTLACCASDPRPVPDWAAGIVPSTDLLGDPDCWGAAPEGWLRRAPLVGEFVTVCALNLKGRSDRGELTAADGFDEMTLEKVRQVAWDCYERPYRQVPVPRAGQFREKTRTAGGWELDVTVHALPAIRRARATVDPPSKKLALVDVLWDTDLVEVICPELSSAPLRVPADVLMLGAAIQAERLSAPWRP